MSSYRLNKLSNQSAATKIRENFSRVLNEEYNIPLELAKEFSANWKYGYEHEVHAFSESVYIGIFGAEIGAILYANMRDTESPAWKQSRIETSIKYVSGEIG
ncbi:hypothetical protein GLAREA_06882 [Glarea lozoyensis ATCC 20868]|uniref:Uncharacterized protein n=1 Tax=Glarea lozoyensis (strain ATCC 20868 / MF5171) TaxID=1116229 RepID=S3D9R8_GLAL2|nr:uncharacterized protein GLAREA_06882 [Glarea lozoyensis ATCC 20868]EPE33869.1 hypothetical protein GLAREA_06882 [Glarea lozoyensis ATCC 20868]